MSCFNRSDPCVRTIFYLITEVSEVKNTRTQYVRKFFFLIILLYTSLGVLSWYFQEAADWAREDVCFVPICCTYTLKQLIQVVSFFGFVTFVHIIEPLKFAEFL